MTSSGRLEIDGNRYPKALAYFENHVRHPAPAKALAVEKPFAEGMGLDRSFTTGLEAAAV